MGMIGPRVPFGGSQGWNNTWNSVMGNVTNFYGMDLDHPFKGSPGSSSKGLSGGLPGGPSDSASGPKVPFAGNDGWEGVWNAVMGNLLDFYGVDLDHPFKGSLGSIPGNNPDALNVQA